MDIHVDIEKTRVIHLSNRADTYIILFACIYLFTSLVRTHAQINILFTCLRIYNLIFSYILIFNVKSLELEYTIPTRVFICVIIKISSTNKVELGKEIKL